MVWNDFGKKINHKVNVVGNKFNNGNQFKALCKIMRDSFDNENYVMEGS